MSIKKAFIFRLFLNTVDKARRDPNLIKKIGIIALISGLFFTAVIGVLLYFTVGIAKDLMAKKPDMDLLAMERLIAEKSLILSKEQQQLVSPILETLAQNNLPADQYQALKEQLAKTIDPSQLAQIETWKTSATAKAEDLFTLPPAVAAIIEQYAGPYKELIMTKIDAFQSWWQLTKPENSAELLQKAIQNM